MKTIKHLLFLSFLFSVFVSCSTTTSDINNLKSDREKDGYRGNVKSVKIYYAYTESNNYSIEGENYLELSDADLKMTTARYYDKEGNKTIEQNHRTELETTTKFKHNKDGNVTEERVYDKFENLVSQFSYKYDRRGNQIEKKGFYVKSSDQDVINNVETQSYKYDENGKIIEHITIERGDDEEERILKKDLINLEETLLVGNRVIYKAKLNSNGDKVEYMSDRGKIYYKYNSDNQLVESIIQTTSGERTERYEYAGFSLLRESTYYSGKLDNYTIYIYAGGDVLVEKQNFYKYSNSDNYYRDSYEKFTHDYYGNLVRVEYYNSTFQVLRKYEITYY